MNVVQKMEALADEWHCGVERKGKGKRGSVPQWLLITFSNPKDFLKILLPVRAIVGVQTTQ